MVNKSSKELKLQARETFKKHYWNIFIITLLALLITGGTTFLAVFVAGPVFVALYTYISHVIINDNSDDYNLLLKNTNSFLRDGITSLFKSLFIFLWGLLFIIPGIIFSYAYALTPYISAENKDLASLEVLNMSKSMMNGHKLRLFKLHLSFIGWIILSIFTFGIGFIFLMPYIKTAEINFYLDLVGSTRPNPNPSPGTVIEGEIV